MVFPSRAQRRWLAFLRCLCLSSCLLCAVLPTGSQAQVPSRITPDGTLGTKVTHQDRVHTITGGRRPQNGPNLFHSFDRFDVGTGDTARFTAANPTGIENILSRVTGGQRSHIDGRIQSDIAGANVFLLNPSGVLFGPNAMLYVPGAFHVSTADFLRFIDGTVWHTDRRQAPMLTVASPAAFGFLRPHPAAITIQGSALQVSAGKTLSVVGGDIEIIGDPVRTLSGIPTLGAQSGQITLVSATAPGDVLVNPAAQPRVLHAEPDGGAGVITIAHVALIDASGDGGGTVTIRGGRLVVDGSFIFADTLGDVPGARRGIDIAVAQDMRLMQKSLLKTAVFGAGNGGDIHVTAASLTLTEGAEISGTTFGAGRGGSITLTITEAVTLTGTGTDPDGPFPSGIRTTTKSQAANAGAAGRIQLTAGSLTLTEGAEISSTTSGPGRGGTITLAITEAVTLAGTSPDGRFPSGIRATTQSQAANAGAAGRIELTADALTLTEGAQISGTTFGPGPGGSITLAITEAVTLAGTSPEGRFPSGIRATTQSQAANAGAAGRIQLTADALTLTEGAQISGTTFGPGPGGTITLTITEALTLAGTSPDSRFLSGIRATTQSRAANAGAAGRIQLTAGSLTLTEGAEISGTTFGPGPGGTITLTITEALTLAGTGREGRFPSGIRATTQSPEANAGAAGRIQLTADALTLTEGARISSTTFGPGPGGTITLSITEAVTLAGTSPDGRFPSGILATTASQEANAGAAGQIQLMAGSLTLTEGARISSATLGSGPGGSITLTTTDAITIAGPSSGLFTNAEGSGTGGNIRLLAPTIELREAATISAQSTGPGNAGSIIIRATEAFLSDHSAVTTAATQADGGNITVRAQTMVRLRHSQVTATVGGGAQTTGGNITIDPEFVILEDSRIVANAFEGQGGNIQVTADVFLADPDSQVEASSERGIDGTVDIRAAVTNVSGTIVRLPQLFGQEVRPLRGRCAGQFREGGRSSFILAKRDGLPVEPGTLLPSPLVGMERPILAGREKTLGQAPGAHAGFLSIDDNRSIRVRGGHEQVWLQESLAWTCATWGSGKR